MIRYIDIKDPKGMPIKWWADVEALKKPRKFTFKKGLNILWGPNGSGKTTVIKALARMLHCGQSGNPAVTQTSVDDLFEAFGFGSGDSVCETLKAAVKLSHDGQGVRHFDPSHAAGLTGGGSAFDWDFGMEGIQNTMFKGSAGQTTMMRMDKVVGSIIRREVPEVDLRMNEKTVNDLWAARIKTAKHFLKGTGKKGQPTVLLDEPERSFDFDFQFRIWNLIRMFAPEVQFIVASHSFFALRLPEANYIELTPGYLDPHLIGVP